jgi:hypothetical protein
VPATRRTCLRCGKRPAVGRWQCASCRQAFREWDERDYSAALEGLSEDERKLMTIGDRLDGAGFWAAGATVMRAAQKVGELAAAIEEDLRR